MKPRAEPCSRFVGRGRSRAYHRVANKMESARQPVRFVCIYVFPPVSSVVASFTLMPAWMLAWDKKGDPKSFRATLSHSYEAFEHAALDCELSKAVGLQCDSCR